MKRDIMRAMNLFKAHIVAIFVTLIVGITAVSLIKNNILFSIVMSLFYLPIIYRSGWKDGFGDSKNVGDKIPDVLRAVKVALMGCVVSALFFIIRIAIFHVAPNTAILTVMDIIYRVYNFYFIGFMTGGTFISYAMPVVILFVIYILGYKIGTKRFSFSERYLTKLVYKQNKK